MAKKKKTSKARRESLKTFARKGSNAYASTRYQTDKEKVYGGGKNYTIPADFANANTAATVADTAGSPLIYIDGVLNTTAEGRARPATKVHTRLYNAETLDLTVT